MRCEHLTIKNPVRGQQAECVRCHLELVFNGTRWIWKRELSPRELNEMTRSYDLQKISEGKGVFNHG